MIDSAPCFFHESCTHHQDEMSSQHNSEEDEEHAAKNHQESESEDTDDEDDDGDDKKNGQADIKSTHRRREVRSQHLLSATCLRCAHSNVACKGCGLSVCDACADFCDDEGCHTVYHARCIALFAPSCRHCLLLGDIRFCRFFCLEKCALERFVRCTCGACNYAWVPIELLETPGSKTTCPHALKTEELVGRGNECFLTLFRESARRRTCQSLNIMSRSFLRARSRCIY